MVSEEAEEFEYRGRLVFNGIFDLEIISRSDFSPRLKKISGNLRGVGYRETQVLVMKR